MTRPRCAPRHPHPADPDPERTAERWAELAGRVRDRATGTGVPPLIGAPVWRAAAEPATWDPEPPDDGNRTLARALGGLPGGDRLPDGFATEFATAVLLWQPPLMRGWRLPVGLWTGVLTGPAPGLGPDTLEPSLRDRSGHGRATRSLWSLGGLGLDALREVSGGPAPRDHGLRVRVAVACLFSGRGEIVVRADGRIIRVRPPGWRNPVDLDVGDLATTDPRLARRFLRIFDWRTWLEGPGAHRRGVMAVTTWLAAVAPVDRAATRILAGRPPGTDTLIRPGVLYALRAAGHPAGWAHPIDSPQWIHRHVPVLWWRWALRRLIADPDRARAVERIEAAWVRLCTGD